VQIAGTELHTRLTINAGS